MTVVATIPQPSDVSGKKSVQTTFTLTVLKDCPLTTLVDMAINDMAVLVT